MDMGCDMWNVRSQNVKMMNYKTTIFPVLNGCETLSLPLREDHRPRVLKTRVLRRIFVLKRDYMTGGWINLHNEELHNFYSLLSIIRMK
jgi:hypothetical protein